MAETGTRSNCHLCGYFCGIEVCLKDGRPVKVRPDPSRYPYDASIIAKCRRFAANKELLDHPKRQNHPLKRVGQRGSGQWERVSWDQALDDIAARLADLKARYGPETLATCIGAPHSIYWPMHRFLNLWGTPNNIGIGIVCWNPAIWVESLTYGWPIENELDPEVTRCVILWGINPAESDRSLFWKSLEDYAKEGGTVVVIDPRRTETARLTDKWLAVRPGTDGALALGLLNVILREGLWDHAFVNEFCSGFEDLSERIRDYPPDRVASITGIPSSTISEIARLYAQSKPASIFTGLGIDHSGRTCTQTHRAIAILRAVTGNLDRPGASLLHERSDFIPEVELELSHLLPPAQRAKKIGRDLFPLPTYEGYERLSGFTELHDKRLPARYLTSAHPHLTWQAMATGEPYPIRAMISMASNPMLTQPNTKMVYQALKGLDLSVSLELFMTPTAMLADYVLPITSSMEQPLVQTNGGVANVAYGGPAAVSPLYKRRTDFDFWCELGKRCGQEEHWPWETLEHALDEVFAPTGLTWDAIADQGSYAPENRYEKYEQAGFATPSGKVELFSTVLGELGHDPLPSYIHDDTDHDAHSIQLMTGVRKHPYYASEFRQLKRFRRTHPKPAAEMSPVTAHRLGLEEGDRIRIETSNGRIEHTLALAEMLPDMVSVEYGWWDPEQAAQEPLLGGVWEANANVLTSADTAECDPILGQWNYRSIPCQVSKAAEKREAVTFRKAIPGDRDDLFCLLDANDLDFTEPVEDYLLAVADGRIVGCARVEVCEDMATIRPVVVAEEYRGRGVGRELLTKIMPADRPTALAARGDAVEFYKSVGFSAAEWHALPTMLWEECEACPDFTRCEPKPMVRAPRTDDSVMVHMKTVAISKKGEHEMAPRKHALVIFSKYPEPGVTKTRLMEENGGALSAEEAADLYRAMVLDVATAGLHALERCRQEDASGGDYELYISSSPADRLPKVREMFEAEFPNERIHFIVDEGGNFDEHFNDCFQQIFDDGCHSVVCIGGDHPTMSADLIARAFGWLSHLDEASDMGAMVLAPCQAGGVSLVATTRDAPIEFSGVFYNQTGVAALDALIDLGARNEVPTALLEAVSDVDFMEDLGHTISVVNAMSYAARFQADVLVPERTLDFIQRVGLFMHTPPNEDHDSRSEIDDTGNGRRGEMQRV